MSRALCLPQQFKADHVAAAAHEGQNAGCPEDFVREVVATIVLVPRLALLLFASLLHVLTVFLLATRLDARLVSSRLVCRLFPLPLRGFVLEEGAHRLARRP